MKLSELKAFNESSESKNNFDFVEQWLDKYLTIGKNKWSIQSTTPIVVDARDDIGLNSGCEKIEVQFGKINGDFYSGTGLKTLVGIPKVVTGICDFSGSHNLKHIDAPLPICTHIDISFSEISTIEEVMSNLSDDVFELHLDDTHISSLEGIADCTKVIVKNLYFSGDKWKSGGLGILQMRGLQRFESGTFVPETTHAPNWEKAQKIIRKYIGRPDSIFECQTELIDAGLDEYAKL